MSDFLENLKAAADKGEFNSEAAKKILAINDLADIKGTPEELEKIQEKLKKIQEGSDINSPVTEEKAISNNSEYEEKMKQLTQFDVINKQLATLLDIDDMVIQSIKDVYEFIGGLEKQFKKEIESDKPMMLAALLSQIDSIKKKYNSVIKYK